MMQAAMRAMMATKDSVSIPPYPMRRTWPSFWIIFGVVPEAMREWKPDSAPQAIVMNTNGKREPANTGPFPLMAKSVIASARRTGAVTTTATASNAMTPTFMNVDR
jgi:hypothetical protein